MIGIGKKFFGLGRIKNLTMKLGDAQAFVSVKGKKYDLIIVDMSFGRIIPEFVTSKKFLGNIKALIRNNGIVVINFLREKEYKETSEHLKHVLMDLFDYVGEKVIFLNRFFMVK